MIKPKPMQPAVAGGLTLDDFTVDEGSATVTCPASQTRPVSTAPTVTFGALCRDCPLRAACTTAQGEPTMVLHERNDLLRAARTDWAADPALREEYRTYRPNIEHTVSQIATHSGRRIKPRYRGTTKNNAWLTCRTAALNLHNLVGRGLTASTEPGSWSPDRPQGTQNHQKKRGPPSTPGSPAAGAPPHTRRARPARNHPPPTPRLPRTVQPGHHRAHEPASSAPA